MNLSVLTAKQRKAYDAALSVSEPWGTITLSSFSSALGASRTMANNYRKKLKGKGCWPFSDGAIRGDDDLLPIEDNPEDDADPWAEGAEAAEAWKSMKTNPYPAGSEQRQLWDDGYHSVAEENNR